MSACCDRYHRGARAPTVLALMRSRYTAYVRGEIEYLVATHDESTRAIIDVDAVARWSREKDTIRCAQRRRSGAPARDPCCRRGKTTHRRPDETESARAVRTLVRS